MRYRSLRPLRQKTPRPAAVLAMLAAVAAMRSTAATLGLELDTRPPPPPSEAPRPLLGPATAPELGHFAAPPIVRLPPGRP